MSSYWQHNRVDVFNTTALDMSGANGQAMVFGRPVDVKRIILKMTVAQTVAPATITVQKIPLATGTSNPETLGEFVVPVGAAIGDVLYFDLARPSDTDGTAISGAQGIGGAKTYDALPDLGKLDAGEQLRVLSDGGGNAGSAVFFAEYQEQGNTGERFPGTLAARA